MRGVARTLGVSLSSIQHHYPTKDDLWRAAVDDLTSDAIARKRRRELPDLAKSIATLLEEQSRRPGLLAALLTDTDDGCTERIAYLARSFSESLAGPTEEIRGLQELGLIRPVNARAFFALMTIGIGSIAGAPDALEGIYGFDISTEEGRTEIATALADILSLGLLTR